VINIALIDDHPLAINGIGAWLCATGRFAIAGTAGTLAEARALMEGLETLPEIVILDVSLGAEDGLAFIPELEKLCKERNTAVPGILVCSMYEDPFLIQRIFEMGAQAYIAKSSAEAEEFITAIEAILEGKTYINPKYQLQADNRPALTRRENEIAALVKQALSTQQIAKRLGISARTVENHLAHIYVKTNTPSRKKLFEM